MEDKPTYAELLAEIEKLKAREKHIANNLTSAVSDRKAALDENKQLWMITDAYRERKDPDEYITPQVNFNKRTTVIGRRYPHI